MLVIPGDQGKVTCDGITRRELMRVGGSALLGLSLPQILQLRAASAAESVGGGPGWNKAKRVIHPRWMSSATICPPMKPPAPATRTTESLFTATTSQNKTR